MHQAMRGLIQKVLENVKRDGLPGDHHFFITFETEHPDVDIAQWLVDRYPGEMTVVMQHWYDGLEITDDGFSITLNFGDAPETLYIPYDAIRTFVDPSVEFGLRFETQDEDDDEDMPPLASVDDLEDIAPVAPATAKVSEPLEVADPEPEPEPATGQVVSLDSFRK